MVNIACWSGPRNLSTAMMYSFGARADCGVWDEPYYGAFLDQTGIDHPLRAEVLASAPTDPRAIAARCAAPDTAGHAHFYQKHMCHNMLPSFDLGWIDRAAHVFLIRHPARVLASYAQKRQNPALKDIGYEAQTHLFEDFTRQGLSPTVIDSFDIRNDPQSALKKLCARIGIPFDPAMLSWPQGGHPDDGVWASHWYNAVHASTGFAGAEGELPMMKGDLAAVCDAAMPYYEAMKARAI